MKRSYETTHKPQHRRKLPAVLATAAVLLCILTGLYVWYAWSPVVTFDAAGVEVADAGELLTPAPYVLRTTGKNVRFHIVGTSSEGGIELSVERYSPLYLWWNNILDAHSSHIRQDTAYYPVSPNQEYRILCKDGAYACINGVLTLSN